MQSIYDARRLSVDPAVQKSGDRATHSHYASRLPPGLSTASPPTSNSSDATLHSPQSPIDEVTRPKEETREEKDSDPYLVVFPEDADDNPRRWSYPKKIRSTMITAQMVLLVGAASSINSAAISQAAKDLGVSEEVMSLDTCFFLVGFGVASPFFAPLSEVGGRGPVYIATLFLFTIFQIASALSPNIASRVVLRFLAGFFASCPLANAGGTLNDLWHPRERTLAFIPFAMCGFMGPTLGPVMGGWIGMSKLGYRWCDWISAIWGAETLLMTLLFLPETFEPTLLTRRAAAMRKATGNPRYMSSVERVRETAPFSATVKDAMLRPFLMIAKEPIVLFFSLYLTVVYVVLFGDLISYPQIFGPYGLNTGLTGLCFLSIAIGLVILASLSPLVYLAYAKDEAKVRRETGNEEAIPAPEVRLKIAMIGTWLVPISLFWLAWTCYTSIPIWVPLASQTFFGIGILCCFIASFQYIIDAYGSFAASALSAMTIFRYPVSGAAVMWTGPMFKKMGNHWALTFLGILAILISFIPYVFYFYGPKIRSWSKYTPKY